MSGLSKHKGKRQKHKATYYSVQAGRTETNKALRLGRQIRRFPTDTQACTLFEKRYGSKRLLAMRDRPTRKGRRLLAASRTASGFGLRTLIRPNT
jgi:hypothetical protein